MLIGITQTIIATIGVVSKCADHKNVNIKRQEKLDNYRKLSSEERYIEANRQFMRNLRR